MKAMKKLLALVLAVCMLIGMPLSIDVSASGGGTATNAAISDPTTFELQWAYPATDAMLAATNSPTSVTVGGVTYEGDALKGRILLLQFTGPVGNTYDQQTAKLWTGTRLAVEKPDGTVVHSFQWYNMGPWFTSTANPFYWILKDHTLTISEQEYVIDSFDDIYALMEEGGPYAGLGYKLVYRLWEQGEGADTTNGMVDSYYNSNLKDLKLIANTKNGDFDCCSIEVTRPADMPTMKNAVRVDDNRIMVEFSEGITWRRSWNGVRIVNSKGQLLCYNASGFNGDANNKYAFSSSGHLQVGGAPVAGRLFNYINVNLSDNFGSTGKSMDQHLADAIKEDPDAGYFMAYVMQSEDYNTGTTTYGLAANRGEYSMNWVCDNIWTTNGEKPLLALVSNKAVTTQDSLILPIQSYEDFKAENADRYVFMESATEVPFEGNDRIFIRFSEAIGNTVMNRYMAVRVYDKYNNLMYLDANNKPTTSSATGKVLQWGANIQAYSAVNGKNSGFVVNNGLTAKTGLCEALNTVDTISELRAWMEANGMPRSAGYKICYSISQVNSTDTPNWDGQLECVTSGSKKLFANGATGEDRAYVEIESAPEAVAVQKVEIINNFYALIHLNQDVTYNNGMFAAIALTPDTNSTTLSWYDATAGYNTSTGTDLQASLSIAYYGNAKNVLLAKFNNTSPTADRSLQWILDHQAAAKAAGVDLKLCLRLNDSKSDAAYYNAYQKDEHNGFLDSWMGVNKGAYAGIVTATNGFDVRNFALTEPTNVLSGVNVTVVDENTAKLQFNKPVIVEPDGYTMWLTKYKTTESGDIKFNAYTGSDVLWQAKFDPSTITAINPDGNGASMYWTVDLDSSVTWNAMGVASQQVRVQSEWTYGIRFEQTGNNDAGMNAPGLVDTVYTADGEYLPANSVESGTRHFIELSASAEYDDFAIVDAKVINETTVQVKFDRPVSHVGGAVYVQVYNTENRVSKIDGTIVEFNCNPERVGGAYGFSDTWNLVSGSSYWTGAGITQFASQFFYMNGTGTNWWDDGTHTLGITFYDQENSSPIDGAVGSVTDVYGNLLQAAEYTATPTLPTATDRTREQAFFSLMHDDYLLMDDSEVEAQVVTGHNGVDSIVLTTPALQDAKNGGFSVRVYNGTDLVQIDGVNAIWPVSKFSNYNNYNYKFATTLIETFGCDTLAEIKALLAEKDIEYTDVYFAIQESTTEANRKGDGNIYKFHATSAGKYMPLKADILDATNGDMALIPLVEGDTEMLHVETLTARKNTANNTYLVELNMSHPVNMDVMMKALADKTMNIWLNAKHGVQYELVNTQTGAASSTNCSHTNISGLFTAVSSTKLVANVPVGTFETIVAAVDSVNESFPATGAELAIRIEHSTAPTGISGSYINSGYMIPADAESDVLTAIMQDVWGNQTGRVWATMTVEDEINANAIVDGQYLDVSTSIETVASGSHVVLINDVTFAGQNGVAVEDGAVLDLNGKTLNLGTGSLVGNGHVIDSADGEGLVKIEYLAESQMANFAPDNPQLPLYDSAKTGYRLFNTEVIAVGTKEATTDSCKYGFKVTFTNSAAYALLKDVDYNDTTVAFELDTARLDEAHRSCPLVDAKLADYAQKMIDTPDTNWVITLKITGLEKLNDDPLTVAGKITSAGTEMRVTIPVTNA